MHSSGQTRYQIQKGATTMRALHLIGLGLLSMLIVRGVPAQPRSTDSVGIKLGMSVKETRAAIALHNARLDIVPVTLVTQPSSVVALYAWPPTAQCRVMEAGGHMCQARADETLRVYFGATTGRAYQIVRQVQNSDARTESDLVTELFAKYGETKVGSTRSLIWAWDATGKRSSSCMAPGDVDRGGLANASEHNCAVVISAVFQVGETGALKEYTVVLLNRTMMLEDDRATARARNTPPPERAPAPTGAPTKPLKL